MNCINLTTCLSERTEYAVLYIDWTFFDNNKCIPQEKGSTRFRCGLQKYYRKSIKSKIKDGAERKLNCFFIHKNF